MNTTILMAMQVGSAIVLMITILLQQRGSGLSSGIMGSSMEYSTKRGVEKALFYSTIASAVVFVGISIARLILG